MADTTADCDVSDPYIERLRKKYLKKDRDTAGTSTCWTTGTSDAESFAPLPANPSLTESERKHYNRAMKELGKAFKLSENHLKTSIADFEKSIKSSDDPSDRTSAVDPGKDGGFAITPATEDDPENDVSPWPTGLPVVAGTLPSTIAVESQDAFRPKRTVTTTNSSSHDPALFWDDESSSLTGISRQFYSNSDTEKPVSMPDIKAIYEELMRIYQKLQDEKKRIAERQTLEEKLEENFDAQAKELAIREAFLLEKERELLERERALAVGLQNLKRTREITAKLEGVELEVQEKIDLLQQNHQLEIESINAASFERAKELKRLRNSFETVKEQNDELKNKLANVLEEFKKSTMQNNKLKKRLENLQRRQDFRACKSQNFLAVSNKSDKENSVKRPLNPDVKDMDKIAKKTAALLDALSVTFDWVSEVSLRGSDTSKLMEKTIATSDEFISDKCLKILPLMVDIIKILPSQSIQRKNQLSFLSFVYLALCRIDDSQQSLVSSTTRRLGEEIYKPSASSCGVQKSSSASLILATTASSVAIDALENSTLSERTKDSKSCPNAYFRSSNTEIRLLSSFIVLKTLHQVDVLAIVFGQLKRDLKEETMRKMFLDYHASHVILPYIVYRANKALMGDAVDVILQLSMESSILPVFLEQCSTEQWFRAFSSALRGPSTSVDRTTVDVSLLEKLSIVLQKLSKIKSNRKYFDAFSLGKNLQECYRSCDPKNTFLTLNLRSVLFNLNLLKDCSQTSGGTL